jgi:hypothetical protein
LCCGKSCYVTAERAGKLAGMGKRCQGEKMNRDGKPDEPAGGRGIEMPAGQDAGDYSLLSERERAEFAALAESFQAEKSGLLAVEVPWRGS